jgi:hypothetical protein
MDVSPRNGRAAQTAQRVKVGVTGLAVVLLLILLAGALLRSVGHGSTEAGAAHAGPAGNLAAANTLDAENEPLAEIGVAPADSGNDAGRPHAR